jgi:hypothetical protein
MASSGVTGLVDYRSSPERDWITASSQSQPRQGATLARSLLICPLLAAGLAALVISLGGEGQPGLTLAVERPVLIPSPGSRVAQRPTASENATDSAVSPTNADLLYARLDRVPLDFLVPDPSLPTAGDPEDILEFGPMRIRRHLVATIVKAAKATGVDPVLLMAIADKESSFATHVKAKTSSATGLFQFIDATWLKVMRDFGAKHGMAAEAKAIVIVDDEFTVVDAAEKTRILELRRDPMLSALMAGEMLNRDRARIAQRIGRDLTHGEVYLAHFLGPNDAERFMAKVVEEPKTAAARLLPRPARANKPIFFARAGRKARSLSVAEVHEKFEDMITRRTQRYRDAPERLGAAAAYAEMR